jgi:ribosomal protein S18 acetylase RimI-like enzyme
VTAPESAAESAAALRVRGALGGERAAVRDLTLAAYAEYARVMAPEAWALLDRAVRAALDGAAAGNDGAECIVAERAGALVGSVFLFPAAADAYAGFAEPPRWPELRLLAVAPAARGLGAGEALVRECARRARAAGADALGLHTSASMAAARRMYARLGFVRAPEYDFRPAGAELVEGYRLPLRDTVA